MTVTNRWNKNEPATSSVGIMALLLSLGLRGRLNLKAFCRHC